MTYLYILDISPLSDIGLVKIFFKSVGCCFVFLTVSFALQKLFSSWGSICQLLILEPEPLVISSRNCPLYQGILSYFQFSLLLYSCSFVFHFAIVLIQFLLILSGFVKFVLKITPLSISFQMYYPSISYQIFVLHTYMFLKFVPWYSLGWVTSILSMVGRLESIILNTDLLSLLSCHLLLAPQSIIF